VCGYLLFITHVVQVSRGRSCPHFLLMFHYFFWFHFGQLLQLLLHLCTGSTVVHSETWKEHTNGFCKHTYIMQQFQFSETFIGRCLSHTLYKQKNLIHTQSHDFMDTSSIEHAPQPPLEKLSVSSIHLSSSQPISLRSILLIN